MAIRAVLYLALFVTACSPSIHSDVGKGSLGLPLLAGHDYDPIADAVVSWRLRSGERAGQSFVLSADTSGLRAIRLKLARIGTVPPLEYRLGSAWDSADLAAGRVHAKDVPLFFERWLGIDIEPVRLEGGRSYYLQLRVLDGEGTGYYELFGTASAEVDHPSFQRRYQYTPTWGELDPQAGAFENPANVDYGSRTPEYRDGTALAEDGSPIAEVDFAFQLSSQIEPAAGDGREERFAFVADDLLAPLHRQLLPRAAASAVAADEIELTSAWTLFIPASSHSVIQTAAADFRQFMKHALQVEMAVESVPNVRAVQTAGALVVGTRRELPTFASELNRPESFRLTVTGNRIVICGFDERGIMRGLYYLEDLMRFRGAPVLARTDEARAPLYSPRITVAPFYTTQELELPADVYSDELLSRISHYGFDGIWVWANLFDVGQSATYPGLANGVERRQQTLREITQRAARYGVDVYVMLAHYPLPSSFFDAHPEVRGTTFKAHGGDFVLCTSAAEARRALGEATKDLFVKVPRLGGIIFIVGGEGFIHCHTRRVDCPRCSSRAPQDVIAELVETIKRSARSARTSARVVVWPYSASNWWSKDDVTQSRLVEKLQAGVTFLTEFGKEGRITFNGTSIPAYDYPISYLGPSERFVDQARLTERRGIALWSKTEHAIALEMIQAPYIPVFFRWAERLRRIHEFPWVSGLVANWMHYGFMPSIAAEVFKWHTWSPLPDTEELLRRLARREFGAGTEGAALEAWRAWSDAMRHYPFSGPMAMGPIQKGPAHPLFLDPAYEPRHHHGRQFTNDLSWTRPWGAEVALGQLEKLEKEWEAGMTAWDRVVARTAPRLSQNAVREKGVAAAVLASVRSTIHVGRFYQTRGRLQQERNAGRRAELWDTLASIAEAELRNAHAALDVVRRDSRLGYANSGGSSQTGVPRGGVYSPGSIEKKIDQVERLLNDEIPARRAADRLAGGEERHAPQ